MNILDWIYRSEISSLPLWGLPGLLCLWQSALRFIWWRKVQHMAHTFTLAVFFLLMGIGLVAAALLSADHPVIDFRWILPPALVVWLLMQIVLLVSNILLSRKLNRVGD